MSFQRATKVPTPYFQSHQFILKRKYILFLSPWYLNPTLLFYEWQISCQAFTWLQLFFNVNKIILLILAILTFRSSCSSFIFFVVFIEPLTCLWRAKLKIFVKVLTAGPSISKRSFWELHNRWILSPLYWGLHVYFFLRLHPSWELYVKFTCCFSPNSRILWKHPLHVLH